MPFVCFPEPVFASRQPVKVDVRTTKFQITRNPGYAFHSHSAVVFDRTKKQGNHEGLVDAAFANP